MFNIYFLRAGICEIKHRTCKREQSWMKKVEELDQDTNTCKVSKYCQRIPEDTMCFTKHYAEP